MTANFLDSNIFVYLFDNTDELKQAEAKKIVESNLRNGTGTISFQVVQEVLNVVSHKMAVPLTPNDAIGFLDAVLVPCWRVFPSAELYRRAIEIKTRYQYGFYDSLIVAAALSAGCKRLLSEDLHGGQMIANLEIVNPFA